MPIGWLFQAQREPKDLMAMNAHPLIKTLLEDESVSLVTATTWASLGTTVCWHPPPTLHPCLQRAPLSAFFRPTANVKDCSMLLGLGPAKVLSLTISLKFQKEILSEK